MKVLNQGFENDPVAVGRQNRGGQLIGDRTSLQQVQGVTFKSPFDVLWMAKKRAAALRKGLGARS